MKKKNLQKYYIEYEVNSKVKGIPTFADSEEGAIANLQELYGSSIQVKVINVNQV